MQADLQSKTTLEIISNPGKLPQLWQHPIIFVANLLSLFFGNEKETGELRQQVGPLETYGGRLIPILDLLFHGKETNMVVLEQAPDDGLLSYFSERLQLRLPDIEVLPHEIYQNLASNPKAPCPSLRDFLDRAHQHKGDWLDGFVTDQALENMAARLGKRTICSRKASRLGNNKYLLHEHLVASGLQVFDTEIAHHPNDVDGCLKALRKQGYQQAAIKAQIGASGIGLIRLSTNVSADVPCYLFHEGPCLVQGWLDDSVAQVEEIRSPSVQLFVSETSLTLYDLTDQILSSDSIHEGNIAIPQWLSEDTTSAQELLQQGESCGRWLHAQGYRGTASVDFHVAERGGTREVRVCEINARVTGATYPSILARNFTPDGVWLMRNLKFARPLPSHLVLTSMEQSELLFLPGQNRGILPINFNLNESGEVIKGQFLCLGESIELVWQLLNQARGLLPVRGEYDRD